MIGKLWRVGRLFVLFCCASLGCASGRAAPQGSAAGAPAVGLVAGPAPTVATGTTLTLAGARCSGVACRCREPGRDDEETAPPAEGSKRLEIRLEVAGGIGSLDLSNLGHVATPAGATEGGGAKETCAYIDVPAGSTHQAAFVAVESVKGGGIAPRLSIAEYGPRGPYWYDVVAVSCEGPTGRCDRPAADRWGVTARQRKRGRLDPCGSIVVTQLAWETSGGQAERDGGLFRDFTTRFSMEIKKFATQFAPGSTECVPK